MPINTGRLPGNLAGQVAADLAPVNALPGDELCLAEGLRIQAAGLALGPAVHLARPHIDRVRIVRGLRGIETEREIAAVRVKDQTARDALGHGREWVIGVLRGI